MFVLKYFFEIFRLVNLPRIGGFVADFTDSLSGLRILLVQRIHVLIRLALTVRHC